MSICIAVRVGLKCLHALFSFDELLVDGLVRHIYHIHPVTCNRDNFFTLFSQYSFQREINALKRDRLTGLDLPCKPEQVLSISPIIRQI